METLLGVQGVANCWTPNRVTKEEVDQPLESPGSTPNLPFCHLARPTGSHSKSGSIKSDKMENFKVLIHWVNDPGLKFSLQKVFTVEWEGTDPKLAAMMHKKLKAKWYPQERYSRPHKGVHECIIVAIGGKSFGNS